MIFPRSPGSGNAFAALAALAPSAVAPAYVPADVVPEAAHLDSQFSPSRL